MTYRGLRYVLEHIAKEHIAKDGTFLTINASDASPLQYVNEEALAFDDGERVEGSPWGWIPP